MEVAGGMGVTVTGWHASGSGDQDHAHGYRVSRHVRGHYLKHNAVTRVPRTFVYVDTEAHVETVGRQEVHRFRLGVAACDQREHNRDGYHARTWCRTIDADELWDWIVARCPAVGRCVLVAHNVAYDLRLLAAFTALPARGFDLVTIRLEDRQSWCVWRRGRQTLVCVDTLSWVPASLAKIGDELGVPKLELPEWEADDAVWFERCERDVVILAELWRRLMGWVRDDDLGNWKPTGAGQSWGAFRHRFLTDQLFVHEDDDARAAERRACWTGRVECWRWGEQTAGPFYEWDAECAYAHIGRECAVPTKLIGELRVQPGGSWPHVPRGRAMLAEVDVTTSVPVLACYRDGGIVWPVGTFTTTAWDCELELARECGATITVRRAWQYRSRPALAGFCGYVLDLIAGVGMGTDPVVRLAAKHWARALIGRMGANWSRTATWGRSSDDDVCLELGYDATRGETFRLLHVGRQLLRVDADDTNPDAMVAVLSWVMAQCRVRLWRAMTAAGLSHVVYVDTDALIVDRAGHAALLAAGIPRLRVKGVYESLELFGPRQLVAAETLRAAGIPREAERVGARSWEGRVWRGLPASLSLGESDIVSVVRRVFAVHGRDKRRRHVAGGRTEAFRVRDVAEAVG